MAFSGKLQQIARLAAFCGELQRFAANCGVFFGVLGRIVANCSVLQHFAANCGVLHRILEFCSESFCFAAFRSELRQIVAFCSVLRRIAAFCSKLQQIAANCSHLQRFAANCGKLWCFAETSSWSKCKLWKFFGLTCFLVSPPVFSVLCSKNGAGQTDLTPKLF